MSDVGAYIGEIRYLAGTFVPRGWYECAGQTLAISQEQVLYSIIGTAYGGDGRTSFKLPDLRGTALGGVGQGPGLRFRLLGASTGNDVNTLQSNNLPPHTHPHTYDPTISRTAVNVIGTQEQPAPGSRYCNIRVNHLGTDYDIDFYKTAAPAPENVRDLGGAEVAGNASVSNAGSSMELSNIMPSLAFTAAICVDGIYPPRS